MSLYLLFHSVVGDVVRNDPKVSASYLGTDERAIERSGAAPVDRGSSVGPCLGENRFPHEQPRGPVLTVIDRNVERRGRVLRTQTHQIVSTLHVVREPGTQTSWSLNGRQTRARLAVVPSGGPQLAYDPYDDAIDAAPHGVWRRLRDEAPLYYNEQYDFYALSRFADVMAASLDWQTYSSARGTVLEIIDTTPPAPDANGSSDGYGMMIFMDPPGHDELRRLVSRAFTPRRVTALENRTRELCAQFLDPYREGGGFDYVEDFAAKIPAMLIGALLGVPAEDQDQLRIWGDLLMRFEPEGISAEKRDAITSLNTYMTAMVTDRQHQPRDDMVSDLLAAEITRDDGTTRRLGFDEVMGFFTLLQLAGSETTARLLGWAAVLLARHPDQRAKLVATPELVPNAVEELLRYEAPSPIQARFVTRDVEWHGQKVPRYSKLAMLTGSAGRDEREFVDADRFDVERTFDRHVTFGYGIHFCLGANLARLEGRIVLEETLARYPHWDVDEAAVEMVRTSTVRGPVHVPVTI